MANTESPLDEPKGARNDNIEEISGELKQQLASEKNVPAGTDTLTPEEVVLNKRVNRKMDLAMLPMLSLLYLFNGLDKGNVGNAETQGKSEQKSISSPIDADATTS
jgi:hypothetical protein